MRRNVNRKVYNDRKNVSATAALDGQREQEDSRRGKHNPLASRINGSEFKIAVACCLRLRTLTFVALVVKS